MLTSLHLIYKCEEEEISSVPPIFSPPELKLISVGAKSRRLLSPLAPPPGGKSVAPRAFRTGLGGQSSIGIWRVERQLEGAGKRGREENTLKKKAMKQARCGDFDGGERKQRTKKTDTARNFIIGGGYINNGYINKQYQSSLLSTLLDLIK